MKLRDLETALRNGGIGLWVDGGWRERGNEMSGLRAIIVHHTAGGGSNDWRIVRDGRAGLSGPLSHMTLERDGGVRLLASGRCNHAGTGSHPRIGTNNANSWAIGIEGVSPGAGNNVWTSAQRREYPRLCAVLCRHYGLPAEAVIGHKEWTSRKIDPGDWNMNDFRAEVRKHLAGGGGEAPRPVVPEKKKGIDPVQFDITYGIIGEDGNFTRDPDGLNFRATLDIEETTTSLVIDGAWARFATLWGGSEFQFYAYATNGMIAKTSRRYLNPHVPSENKGDGDQIDYWPIPARTRAVALEGKRETSDTFVSGSILAQAK